MRRSSVYLLVALAFVAVWAIVAGVGFLLFAPSSAPAQMTVAESEPLPADMVAALVGDEKEDVARDVLSRIGGPPPEPTSSPTKPLEPDPADDKPDVRGFEPIAPAQPVGTDRSFEDPVDPIGLADKPRPVDQSALGGLIERLKRSKETGLLKPEIPDQMTAFETQRVKIVLARQAEAVALVSAPDADLKKASEIPVRDFVSVKLYGGKDFKVEAIAEDASVRSLKGGNLAEWEFDVTPISGGSHDLEIIVLLYDEPAFLPVAKFSQKITVDVPFGSRLRLVWSSYGGDWIVNLLLAPLFGAVIAFFVKEWLIRRRQLAGGPRPSDDAGKAPPGIHPG